jgi:hypothetical protein
MLHPICADMWDWLEQQTEHKSGKSGEQFLTGLRGKATTRRAWKNISHGLGKPSFPPDSFTFP